MTARRPTGTVYGRGGIDVREPRDGLHPVVLGLLVVAALTVTVALGYWVFLRGPSDAPPPAAQAGPQLTGPQSTGPQSTGPQSTGSPSAGSPSIGADSPTPSPSAAAIFGTGRVLLSPAADPDTYLVTDGDFAAMSTDESMVLTVSKGLADSECFTIREENGRYLRHFNFRLRFDIWDDSDLFRKDATFCLADDQSGGAVRLRSKNYPDRLLHRRGAELYIDKSDGSGAFRKDSSFTVRPG